MKPLAEPVSPQSKKSLRHRICTTNGIDDQKERCNILVGFDARMRVGPKSGRECFVEPTGQEVFSRCARVYVTEASVLTNDVPPLAVDDCGTPVNRVSEIKKMLEP